MELIAQTNRLVHTLIDEPGCESLSTAQVEHALVQIKTNGRAQGVSRSLRQQDLSRLVDLYVLRKAPAPSRRAMIECLTILANALVWSEDLLASFEPGHVITKVLNECFQPSVDAREEYLFMRLLFLFTFHGRRYDEKLIKTGLAAVASKISYAAAHEAVFTTEMERLAFIECMKFTFNLLHHYPLAVDYVQGYTARALVKIFYTLDPREEHDLCQHISNCLLCLPVAAWLYENDSLTVLERILAFVEIMVDPVNENLREDRILAPPLSLLHCIVSDLFKTQQQSDESSEKRASLRSMCRERILPSASDRKQVLGTTDSLASYLLRITIDPVLRTTRNIIFDIFWKLSHESPDEFVGNFGLGYASSFLASHGIAFPESVNTTQPSTPTTTSDNVAGPSVNPITGQYVQYEKQTPNPVDEMTEEEKERDAERMFVLFERLKANNMIKVQNPVEVAARQGKLHELDN
ncbi:hypothetical protein TRICI_006718 [Trichomonascus ciferrii]|uniref:Uncharacterized protein n=1 Tax=Trichomonascus ciferrii TaxID=44093 RepID=A0A642UEB7_9ASCO|nr:hypothetical protein TRICI_006718 [Trichomonascus ciferrii]